MNKQTYGIKHKVTGLFFGGFDADRTLWVPESFAKGMDLLHARAQATLLSIHGADVQRKPVAVVA